MAHKSHITEYKTLGLILVLLVCLTGISVFVTWIDLAAWSVTVALVLASVKAFLVLLWFMHLKFDKLLFKLMVGMVFLLFAIVIVVTFLDYIFR